MYKKIITAQIQDLIEKETQQDISKILVYFERILPNGRYLNFKAYYTLFDRITESSVDGFINLLTGKIYLTK